MLFVVLDILNVLGLPVCMNDITAYKQTDLYKWFLSKAIPECYHSVLDEAYGSIGGDQHLTPFTRHQLRAARKISQKRYEQMKSFNNFLSSQRITIKGAFGMFVRKWGILWRPLEHSVGINTKIVMVCAKLHNVSITAWKLKGKRSEEIAEMESKYLQHKDAGIFMGWQAENVEDLDGEIMSDATIARIMGNHIPCAGYAARSQNQRKEEIVKKIYDAGFRYNLKSDNDFTFDNMPL